MLTGLLGHQSKDVLLTDYLPCPLWFNLKKKKECSAPKVFSRSSSDDRSVTIQMTYCEAE